MLVVTVSARQPGDMISNFLTTKHDVEVTFDLHNPVRQHLL